MPSISFSDQFDLSLPTSFLETVSQRENSFTGKTRSKTTNGPDCPLHVIISRASVGFNCGGGGQRAVSTSEKYFNCPSHTRVKPTADRDRNNGTETVASARKPTNKLPQSRFVQLGSISINREDRRKPKRGRVLLSYSNRPIVPAFFFDDRINTLLRCVKRKFQDWKHFLSCVEHVWFELRCIWRDEYLLVIDWRRWEIFCRRQILRETIF